MANFERFKAVKNELSRYVKRVVMLESQAYVMGFDTSDEVGRLGVKLDGVESRYCKSVVMYGVRVAMGQMRLVKGERGR
jgi:hypothetical protein